MPLSYSWCWPLSWHCARLLWSVPPDPSSADPTEILPVTSPGQDFPLGKATCRCQLVSLNLFLPSSLPPSLSPSPFPHFISSHHSPHLILPFSILLCPHFPLFFHPLSPSAAFPIPLFILLPSFLFLSLFILFPSTHFLSVKWSVLRLNAIIKCELFSILLDTKQMFSLWESLQLLCIYWIIHSFIQQTLVNLLCIRHSSRHSLLQWGFRHDFCPQGAHSQVLRITREWTNAVQLAGHLCPVYNVCVTLCTHVMDCETCGEIRYNESTHRLLMFPELGKE